MPQTFLETRKVEGIVKIFIFNNALKNSLKIIMKEIGFSRRVDILLQNSNSKPETSLGYPGVFCLQMAAWATQECSAFMKIMTF